MNNILKPKVITLCGSTRFYKEFQQMNYELTMKGNIVLSVGFFPHSSEEVHGEKIGITEEQKKALDELHKRKIDMSDEIFVINKDGYIGESTQSEINYAAMNGKIIVFMEPPSIEDKIVTDYKIGITQADIDAFRKMCEAVKKEYYKKHNICPICGNKNNSQTYLGMVISTKNYKDYKDTNDCWCGQCGWKGIVDELVQEKKNSD